MIIELSNEQIEYIVDTYGTNKSTVNKIVKILNELELPFADEEDFIVTVANVVSVMETECFEKSIGKKKKERAGYTLLTAIILILNQKFNNDELYDNVTINKIFTLQK